MKFIFIVFIVDILNILDELFNQISLVLFDIVFRPFDLMETNLFADLAPIFRTIGVALIIMMFLKKGFSIYVLWVDGDPDLAPTAYLTNFARAIITMLAFPYLYDFFVGVLEDFLNAVLEALSGHSFTFGDVIEFFVTENDNLNLILLLVFAIIYVILLFSLFIRGIELSILNLGVPLACVGLLDNDRGVFKAYFNQYVKAFLSTLLQIMLARVSSGLIFTSANTPLNIVWGIACAIFAVSTPKLIQEFLLQSGGGGHRVTSAVYSTNMVMSMARGFMK